ncbi:MAG: hypothetical protein H6618_04615 [Deltaproteobacteria bacterium]|nr:hypothetical protein [Deltaproteobacteria bacterium]
MKSSVIFCLLVSSFTSLLSRPASAVEIDTTSPQLYLYLRSVDAFNSGESSDLIAYQIDAEHRIPDLIRGISMALSIPVERVAIELPLPQGPAWFMEGISLAGNPEDSDPDALLSETTLSGGAIIPVRDLDFLQKIQRQRLVEDIRGELSAQKAVHEISGWMNSLVNMHQQSSPDLLAADMDRLTELLCRKLAPAPWQSQRLRLASVLVLSALWDALCNDIETKVLRAFSSVNLAMMEQEFPQLPLFERVTEIVRASIEKKMRSEGFEMAYAEDYADRLHVNISEKLIPFELQNCFNQAEVSRRLRLAHLMLTRLPASFLRLCDQDFLEELSRYFRRTRSICYRVYDEDVAGLVLVKRRQTFDINEETSRSILQDLSVRLQGLRAAMSADGQASLQWEGRSYQESAFSRIWCERIFSLLED